MFSLEENRAIGGAIERLGLQLLEKLPIGPQQPNVVLSPLSLAFALAQLTLGQSEFNLVLSSEFSQLCFYTDSQAVSPFLYPHGDGKTSQQLSFPCPT